jgi:hypothetical protein
MLLVPGRALATAIGFWIAFYLLWSMRAVYGGSWIGVFARACLLALVYVILGGLAIAGLVVVAVLLR